MAPEDSPSKESRRTFAGRQAARRDGHVTVAELPTQPVRDASYWLESPDVRKEHLHLLFRFPARFHPPVVRWALRHRQGDGIVVDPFTGSGTVQLEALAKGISSLGLDVDPLSCLVARAKTTPLDPRKLRKSFEKIKALVLPFQGLHAEEESQPGADITEERLERERRDLWIPAIPNISHWFRRYVIVDLARCFWAIEAAALGAKQARFFRTCAASVIRRVSNADPAPVSGLEVTSVQAKRNSKRKIRVFGEFFSKVEQGMLGMEALHQTRSGHRRGTAKVLEGDILELGKLLKGEPLAEEPWDLVITSPPYCRSVEYSRRHRLELYWLNLVTEESEHLSLTHRYIGRNRVREHDWDERVAFKVLDLDATIGQIEAVNPIKARGVRHYFYSMDRVLDDLSSRLAPTGTMLWVMGDSICCGVPIRTADYIAELAQRRLRLANRFTYALRNHYMQYGLWNGAGIKQEHVLVLKPQPKTRRTL